MKTKLQLGTVAIAREQDLTEIIQELIAMFRAQWWATPLSEPVWGQSYSLREQLSKERELEAHLRELVAGRQEEKGREADPRARQERLAHHLEHLAKGGLGLDDDDIQAIHAYGFAEIGLEFIRQARRFDPEIPFEDIYQASRNVWSMNFMQLLTGEPIALTPAVFAYSLLYPYTDNYLDDPQISIETKQTLNERFRVRLMGGEIRPSNRYEERISDLVSLIEGQFDRRLFPQVFESLLAIHEAQGRSLALQQGRTSPYEVDVIGLCFDKGGTAVLADGYLVAGNLTPPQREWMFFYGVFTQLMDDLEDTRRDLQEGNLTIFSQTARRWPLDAITNRTIHLGRLLIARLQEIEAPGAEPFKRMIAKCLDPLVIASAGEVGEFYTRPYLRELERRLPVRFKFLRKQRRKFSRIPIPVEELVEAFIDSRA